MTFDDFIKSIRRNPNLREGQQFMNEVFSERADLYWLIIDRGADCFYDNNLLPLAKKIAEDNWHL